MGHLRLGLLGAGRIGQLHADLLSHRVEGVRLVAVHDANPHSGRSLAEAFELEVTDSPDALFAAGLDAVAICSPTETHASLIERAALAGLHVFCEKPIALELDDVARAIAAVERSGVKLQVGFNRRYDPSHRAVRDRVAAGDVGTPHLVRITSRDPAPPSLEYLACSGGLFLDMTIHDFDMARFLIDDEVVEVFASGASLVDDAIAGIGDIDTALVMLRYRGGALGVIDNSRQAAYGYDQRVEVLGSEGMARSTNHRETETVLETGDGALRPPTEAFFLERYEESYILQWRSFVDAVQNDHPVEVDGQTARVPLLLGLAAQRSLSTGRPVVLEDFERSFGPTATLHDGHPAEQLVGKGHQGREAAE